MPDTYKTETALWRASDAAFAPWQRDAVVLTAGGALKLDPHSAHPGTDPYGQGGYKGGNYYNGGTFHVGEATGPVITPDFAFSQAIASWNATTPAGTWIEVQLRARTGGHWTKWYSMGIWTSSSGQRGVTRHSVSSQADANAYVDVDTLKIGKQGTPHTATAYQLKLRLFSQTEGAAPSVENAAVVVSTTPATPAFRAPGREARWGKVLPVPECSQMVYPDGGEVWCSPTSVAMVLNYWEGGSLSCPASVKSAVSGVYDRIYDGHGNWPFNAAYAASKGLESYVSRFTSIAQAEDWIAAGVPLIMSISWGRNQLTGAPVPSSNGHLVVLAGFDAEGNPVINDPAARSDSTVQRTYIRSEFEKLWLRNSGGTVYLIYPPGKHVPDLP